MAYNEQMLVENSDKCGDECLYVPTREKGRVMSHNAGLYKYRVSLQANVFGGKLFHLTLLLPNLKTGANFGITSFLTGLVRLIKSGEVTSGTKRHVFRGLDGDSANICNVGLAFNNTLAHYRFFDSVQQHRLPPDHSHTWQTDGLFSVLEGWLLHEGFSGARTLHHLMTFLRHKFATSDAYKDQRIEINILLANFAFAKWFEGCIDSTALTRIKVPLVWKHSWNATTRTVVAQYKLALSDVATFDKDEWGPWIEKDVEVVRLWRLNQPPHTPLARMRVASSLLPTRTGRPMHARVATAHTSRQ